MVGSTLGVLIVLIAAGLAIGLTIGSPTTHGDLLTADQGKVVFADGFSNPFSGWQTTPESGATFAYENGAYVIVPTGNFHWFAVAPYQQPVQQMSAAVTATESISAASGVGFGVMCFRGSGNSQVRFEFVAVDDGRWFIEENTGTPSPSRFPTILKQGYSPARLTTATTVEGACSTRSDDRTSSLTIFIDGTDVADVNAVVPVQGSGWLSAIVADSRQAAPSKITATHFAERSIAK